MDLLCASLMLLFTLWFWHVGLFYCLYSGANLKCFLAAEGLLCLFPSSMFIVFSLVYGVLVVLGFLVFTFCYILGGSVSSSLSVLEVLQKSQSGLFPAECMTALCLGVAIALLNGISTL